ncbi:MAG: hypothetical protein AB7V06_25640 [Candidatus Obscuribacterales bacterium]
MKYVKYSNCPAQEKVEGSTYHKTPPCVGHAFSQVEPLDKGFDELFTEGFFGMPKYEMSEFAKAFD